MKANKSKLTAADKVDLRKEKQAKKNMAAWRRIKAWQKRTNGK